MSVTLNRWFPTIVKVAFVGAVLAVGVYAYQEVQERRLAS